MLSLRKPSSDTIRDFLASQSELGFTYAAVGATATVPPAGFAVDRTRIKLGDGQEVFLKSKTALRQWDQFRLGWVQAWSPTARIQAGDVVAVLAQRIGLWWLNACRIVYVVDEAGPIERFGYAYGTLPDHAGTGEERFLVEWDRARGEVWYEILAFSQPYKIITLLGYPYMRILQKRFGRESAAAMVRAVERPRAMSEDGQRTHDTT